MRKEKFHKNMPPKDERYISKTFEGLMSYKESVFRICLGFSKDPWNAEELTQEVFLKAYRKISSSGNASISRGWLFKIAKNTCLDHVKQSRLRRLLQHRFNIPSVENNTPEKRIIQSEQVQILKEGINQLTKRNREVFVLKEYGHLSYEEIASVLGIKKGTVMSRLNRARQAVINYMREVNNEET